MLKSLGLYAPIYYWVFLKDLWRNRRINKQFHAATAGVKLPPPLLRFDVHGTSNARTYHESGLQNAKTIHEIIHRHFPAGPVRVLEWGCGPGRILSHLAHLDDERRYRLTGTDYVKSSVAWARKAYPEIRFEVNQLAPPLLLADASQDFVYAISVFTHLSERAHSDWLAEILRVLCPGGIFLLTTHGEAYAHLLTTAHEKERFAAGELVTFAGPRDGSQMYCALHSAAFMQRFLAQTDILSHEPRRFGDQDVWIVRRRH
jgi:ubiquinone/menaquinone biosynthesis C-methylase UbiE